MSSIIFVCAFFFLGLGNGAWVGLSAAEQLQPFFAREVVAYGRIDSTSVQYKGKIYRSNFRMQQFAGRW